MKERSKKERPALMLVNFPMEQKMFTFILIQK